MSKPARHSLLFTLLTGAVLSTATPALSEVNIAAMCDSARELARYEGCECILSAVRDQVSEEDFEIYGAVYTEFYKLVGTRTNPSDAWDQANAAVAEDRELPLVDVTKITNPLGPAQVQAVATCEG